jgi:hypothetical protein
MTLAFGTITAESRHALRATEAVNENKTTNSKAKVFRRLSYVWCGCREAVRSGCWWPKKRTARVAEGCGC